MKAITLWRPWPAMIVHAPEDKAKRVENRSWRPPLALVGQRIAIHAGEHLDHRALSECARRLGSAMPSEALATAKGIVGTVRVASVTTAAEVETRMNRLHLEWGCNLCNWPEADRLWHSQVWRWFVGPFGWLVDEVRALPEPIRCQGRQGIWTVPAELLERLAA